MNKILISVCIPVYGVEKYIEKCARSLFEQTMQEGIEFIFVDDASPDKSIEILRKVLINYPERESQVRIISAQTNGGLATTRNIAMSYAKGEYIIHCDSDDWVENDMYEILLQRAIATAADIVMCDFIYEYDSKSVVTNIPSLTTSIEYISEMMEGKIHCGVCNKLVKRKLYDQHNISFPDGINMWEDVNTTIRLTYFAKKIEIVNTPLYHYRQTNMQSYTQNVTLQSLNNMKQTIQRLEEFLHFAGNAQLNESLNYMKLTAKLNMLIGTYGDMQREIACIYPEANQYVWKFENLSIYWKVALILTGKNRIRLFNLMVRTKKILNLFIFKK